MIVCEYYKATFQEPTTCIKKQIRLHELLKNNKNDKNNKNTKTPIRSNYGTLIKKEEPIELYTKQAIRTRGGL